jgi:hypothetical protein
MGFLRMTWPAVFVWAWLTMTWAQTTIHLASQGRQADFSNYSITRPARGVDALPAQCQTGEMVYLKTGSTQGTAYICSATDTWSSLGLPNSKMTFTGQSAITITHNKNTKDVLVACYDATGQWLEPDRAVLTDSNSVQVFFQQAQSGTCVVNTSSGGGGDGGSGSSVTSVFGRTGDITAQSGDYSFSQLSGNATLSQGGTNQTSWQAGRCVQVAADGSRLESAAGACGSGSVTSVFGRTGAVTAQTGDYSFTQIGGTAQINQGGTGAASASGARANLLPALTGNAGKVLAVNTGATDVEWVAQSGGGGGYTAGPGVIISGSEIAVNGAVVPTFLTGTASLANWNNGNDNVPGSACAELNFTLTGAATGDAVMAGWPATLPAGLSGVMYVGAADTIVVRLCNATTSAVSVVDGLTFRATILRSF